MNPLNQCKCNPEATEEEMLEMLGEMLPDYKKMPGGLIPALQIAQGIFGYLPDIALKRISEDLDIPYSEVAGVVSFYSFFSRFPRGKYEVSVCMGTACYVRGGAEILKALKTSLGIEVGQTTEDRMFSLNVGRCFGACGIAPVIMVNDETHQRVKADKIESILESYRCKEKEELQEVEV